jgi:hypothetical protein
VNALFICVTSIFSFSAYKILFACMHSGVAGVACCDNTTFDSVLLESTSGTSIWIHLMYFCQNYVSLA